MSNRTWTSLIGDIEILNCIGFLYFNAKTNDEELFLSENSSSYMTN